MARAEVPLSELKPKVDYKDDKKLMQWVINRIEKKATVVPTGKNR